MRVLIVSSQTSGFNASIVAQLRLAGVNACVFDVESNVFEADIPASVVLDAENVHEAVIYAEDILSTCQKEKCVPLFNLLPNATSKHDVRLLQVYLLVVRQKPDAMAVANMVDARRIKELFREAGLNPHLSYDVPEALLLKPAYHDIPYEQRQPTPNELRARSFL